jgi:hypothetical protein
MSLLLNRDAGPNPKSQDIPGAQGHGRAGLHVATIESGAIGRTQLNGTKAMVIVALQAQMPVRYAGVRNVQLRKYAALFAAASNQYGIEVKRKAQVRTVCRTFVGSTLLRCLLAVDCHHRNEARVRGR